MFKKFFERRKHRALARQLRKPTGKAGARTGMMMNQANATLYDFTLGQMQLQPGNQMLEIGFGNGLLFESIFRRFPGIFLTGIDYSADMVAEASAHHEAALSSGQLRLIQGSSDRLPFADAEFDQVFCINVLYFWDNPADHFREVSRVLKPGGRFFATIRSRESLELLPFTQYGFAIRTVDEWKEIAGQSGMQWIQPAVLDEPGRVFNDELIELRSYCLQLVKQ